jgi:hypothetical protein
MLKSAGVHLDLGMRTIGVQMRNVCGGDGHVEGAVTGIVNIRWITERQDTKVIAAVKLGRNKNVVVLAPLGEIECHCHARRILGAFDQAEGNREIRCGAADLARPAAGSRLQHALGNGVRRYQLRPAVGAHEQPHPAGSPSGSDDEARVPDASPTPGSKTSQSSVVS